MAYFPDINVPKMKSGMIYGVVRYVGDSIIRFAHYRLFFRLFGSDNRAIGLIGGCCMVRFRRGAKN